MMLQACAILLLFALHMGSYSAVASSPAWPQDGTGGQQLADRRAILETLRTMLTKLQADKEKRGRADAGFFSRHDALSDYVSALRAHKMAADLFGPGKRK